MTMALTTGQRVLLESLLLQRLHELQRQIALHHGDSRVTHAQALLEARDAGRDVDMALSNLDLRELGDVSLALRRVHGEDYGLCADCGGDIAFDRLRLEPWALRCIGCESASETRQRRQAQRLSL
jgi:DnaK suppressor protein